MKISISITLWILPHQDTSFKVVPKIHTAIILSQTVPRSLSTRITRTHRGQRQD